MKTDNSRISFKVSTGTTEYGDGRKFLNYKIVMLSGSKPVGIEAGPSRTFADRSSASAAARRRISILKTHKLFIVRITEKHITDGEGRQCNTCAIAQALWHNQERMGFPMYQYGFHVSPYGDMLRGIVIEPKAGLAGPGLILEPSKLPDVIYGLTSRGQVCNDSLEHFASGFDDWADLRTMSIAEWREMHGYDEDERPYRPSPCSFVLDLDEFKAAA